MKRIASLSSTYHFLVCKTTLVLKYPVDCGGGGLGDIMRQHFLDRTGLKAIMVTYGPKPRTGPGYDMK